MNAQKMTEVIGKFMTIKEEIKMDVINAYM